MSTVAVIPGTGRIGYGVAWRLAKAGHTVLLTSRDANKAKDAADKILKDFPNAKIQFGTVEELPVESADIIVWCPLVTIPQGVSTLKSYESKFSGKIILDITNVCYRIKPEDEEAFFGKSSATERNREIIPSARWVAGFKNMAFTEFLNEKPAYPGEFYSDDQEALEKVKTLFENTGFQIVPGPLAGARDAEVRLMEWCKANLSASWLEQVKNE